MSTAKKHIPKHGNWHTEGNKVFWNEVDVYGNILKKYDPLKLINISREVSFKIIFVKEYVDQNSFNGKIKKIFAQDIEMHLSENVDDSIVLKFEPTYKKFYISDLKEIGLTFLAPLESTKELIVTKCVPYLITPTEALAILKIWSYGFGKVELDSQGNIESYITTV